MTPLILVVGFLGSGKTTFLKNLMPALALAELRPTLLINDYQNARVDAAQFQDLAEEVKALSGDCVCCGSRDELFSFLREFQHAPGRVMIVETNGTTDSAHLIEFLALDPGLKKFSLPIQLSIIDGKRWQKRFWHNALEREQAKTASHVYISRKDSIGTDRVKVVENSLAEYGVRGVHTDPVAFAMELSNVAASMGAERDGFTVPLVHEHDHHKEANHHFSSCEIPLPPLVDRQRFREWINRLPEEVIRAKGLIVFKDDPQEFVVFQKVDASDEVQFFPVGKSPRIQTPLILLIGPQLPQAALNQSVGELSTDDSV